MSALGDSMGNMLRLADITIRIWAEGRVWWYRVPLLLWMVWLALMFTVDRNHPTLFGPINLAIHEMGHVLFSYLGTTMMFLGGTILQCGAPIAAAIVLIKANDWFGVPFCATWLGTNLCNVAVYMADARDQALPLVSLGGGDVQHDWAYLLGHVGLLSWDTPLAALVTLAAVVVLWSAVASGAWVVWRIARQ